MTRSEAKIRTRVRSARNFSGVPAGTEGVIDEEYSIGCVESRGVMVTWEPAGDSLDALFHRLNRDFEGSYCGYLSNGGEPMSAVCGVLSCLGWADGPFEDAWCPQCHALVPKYPLDSLIYNPVTEEQKWLGWNDDRRCEIMQWFYQHKRRPCSSTLVRR
jgi:hypothetical protein